jgi:hypothetical protein
MDTMDPEYNSDEDPDYVPTDAEEEENDVLTDTEDEEQTEEAVVADLPPAAKRRKTDAAPHGYERLLRMKTSGGHPH